MLGSELARLALADQIMAALAERPMLTSELIERVDTVFCCCPGCRGEPRRAWPDDLYPLLFSLMRRHAVQGTVVPFEGLTYEICWTRLAPTAAEIEEP